MDEQQFHALSLPIARILLLNYLRLRPDAAEATADLGTLARPHIADAGVRRRAIRWFEALADRCVDCIETVLTRQPLVPGDTRGPLDQLAATVAAEGIAGLFMQETPLADAETGLRLARPLPPDVLTGEAVACYEQFLFATLRLVRETVAALPPFELRAVPGSIARLENSKESIYRILDDTRKIEALVMASDEQPEIARIDADFRHEILRTQDYLELFGADITPESRRHALSVAYVSLNLDSQPNDGESEPLCLSAARLLNTLRPGSGRILIRGEAGSGKSTLFRWTTLQAAGPGKIGAIGKPLIISDLHLPEDDPTLENHVSATKWLEEESANISEDFLAGDAYSKGTTFYHIVSNSLPDWDLAIVHEANLSPSERWSNRVPFLVRLRDCPKGKLPGADGIAEFISQLWPLAQLDWVESRLATGQALVLFDGIDEIPNPKRGALAKSLREIIERYPDNYYLLSTRPEAVPRDFLVDLGFREARINPMSDTDRGHFIDNWHLAVRKELEKGGRRSDGLMELASALKEQLANNPQIARLGTNPLLCGMICALHRDRHRRLPRSLTELCEALCHMLLHRREDENQLDIGEFPAPYRQLTYEQKRFLVQQLAESMVLNEESSLDVGEVERLMTAPLLRFPGGRVEDAPTVVRTLIERSGMLREARPGRIDFIHNTLKEFLAAERFALAHHLGLLVKHALDDAWQPVLLFAAATRQAAQALLPETRPFASALIERLLQAAADAQKVPSSRRRGKQPRITDSAQHGYLLMAIRCATVALTLDPEVRRRLDDASLQLFPPQNLTEAEILAYGGNDVIPQLRYDLNLPARVSAACVRALRRIGTPAAFEALREYRNSRFLTVLEEVSQAIDPLECPLVAEKLTSRYGVNQKIKEQIREASIAILPDQIPGLDLSDAGFFAPHALMRFKQLTFLSLDIRGRLPSDYFNEFRFLKELMLCIYVSDVILDLQATSLTSLSLTTWSKSGRNHKVEIPLTLKELSATGSLNCIVDLKNVTELRYYVTAHSLPSDLRTLRSATHLEFLKIMFFHLWPPRSYSEWFDELSDSSVLNTQGARRQLELIIKDPFFADLTPLRSVQKLTRLIISGTRVSDLTPLRDLPNLVYVDARATSVRDVSAVRHVKEVVWDSPVKKEASMAVSQESSRKRTDVALLIALQEEFSHFWERVGGRATPIHEPEQGIFYYEIERVSVNGATHRLVAMMVGAMGPLQTALAAERLNRQCKPRCMAMVGIAGGLSDDVRLGDVVLATQSDAYQENAKAVAGSTEDAFRLEASGEVYRCDEALVRFAQNLPFARKPQHDAWLQAARGWQEQVFQDGRIELARAGLIHPEPRLVCGHVASGTTVSAHQAFCNFLKRRDRRVLAVEMESVGMLAAVPGVRTLVLRGISDYGDVRKHELDRTLSGGFRTYAMLNAIGVLFALLDAGAFDNG